MSATIDDPFLLSSYALSSRTPSTSGQSVLHKSRHVQLTQHRQGKSEGVAAAAVQGDGVHILDLSTLHPVTSHTLGPSTSFASAPATRIRNSDANKIRTTVVAVESSPDLSEDERGRAVWLWEENLSAGSSSVAEMEKGRRSAIVPHPVSYVYLPEELLGGVLLVGPHGELTVTDAHLSILGSSNVSTTSKESFLVFRHFVFSGTSCSFARSAPSRAIISVSFLRDGSDIRAVVKSVSHDGIFGEVREYLLPVGSGDSAVAELSCSSEGFISILTHSGVWQSFELSSTTDAALSVRESADPLQLKSLSFISSTSPSACALEIALASLNTSLVLLVAVTTTSPNEPQLAFLLWDLRYSALLASHTFSIPSSITRSKRRGMSIQLIASESRGPSQALVVLSPSVGKADGGSGTDAGLRSSVLVLPFSVPATSTIANAIGRATAGTFWLRNALIQGAVKDPYLSPGQARVLRLLDVAAREKNVQKAEEAFFAWVKEEERLAKAQPASKGDEAKPALGHVCVSKAVPLVVGEEVYVPKVVRYLLERRAVSSAMVPGGILPAVLARNDWAMAKSVLHSVIDVPEDHLLALLAKVLALRKSGGQRPGHAKDPLSEDEDAMEVDAAPTSSKKPTLKAFLALCVMYPSSPAALRVAFRKHINEAADVVTLLETLDGFLDRWARDHLVLLPQQVKKNGQGVLVPNYVPRKERGLPPEEKVVAFIQTALDASYLTLLTYQPGHALVRRLPQRLDPEIALLNEMEKLRGSLQPFAAAHARAVYEGEHPPKTDTSIDWRRRRKAAHEQAELALGLYQMEELTI